MVTTDITTTSKSAAAVHYATEACEATGRTVIHNMGDAGELWVLPATRVELSGDGTRHIDFPLRYQYTPRYGMARLVTKAEAIDLIERAS